jgi:hypothetical protein
LSPASIVVKQGVIFMKFIFRSYGLALRRTKEMRKETRAKKGKKESSEQEEVEKSLQRHCTRFLRYN